MPDMGAVSNQRRVCQGACVSQVTCATRVSHIVGHWRRNDARSAFRLRSARSATSILACAVLQNALERRSAARVLTDSEEPPRTDDVGIEDEDSPALLRERD